MTQTITNLGEIGDAEIGGQAILTPIDLPLLRDGATWDLTGYSNPAIKVWDLRTKAVVAGPGGVTIEDIPGGVIRWIPIANAFVSGVYEARIKITPSGGSPEGSGLFRFSIGAADQP